MREATLQFVDFIGIKKPDQQLARFLVVGGVAFLVNAVFLFMFHGVLGFNLLVAQIISAELTIIVSFSLHHLWTYNNYQKKPLAARFLIFNTSAISANAIATVGLLFSVSILHLHYLVGYTLGAVVAAFWSYTANKYVIWSQKPNKRAGLDGEK